jgi:hypothetical protein
MAYDSSKLNLISLAPLAVGSRLWNHESADAGATVDTTGFITDGGNRGMKVGDILMHRNTSTNIVTSHLVVTVSSTAPGAVNLSDTTTIVSGTNTD